MIDAATLNRVLEILIHIVFYATILSIVSPPIEFKPFQPFPKFLKYYAIYIGLIQYIALNVRGKLAQAYSARQNGNGEDKADAAGAGQK